MPLRPRGNALAYIGTGVPQDTILEYVVRMRPCDGINIVLCVFPNRKPRMEGVNSPYVAGGVVKPEPEHYLIGVHKLFSVCLLLFGGLRVEHTRSR